MSAHKMSKPRPKTLYEQFPPSRPCTCEVCVSFCARPGWWTMEEAARAIEAGYAGRMMLEMAPDNSFGVLSPAFKGSEVNFALDRFKANGCTFLTHEQRCELFGTGHTPLECCFCHHDRPGQGPKCHRALEKDWNTPEGKALVVRWAKLTGFWERVVRR